MNHPVVVGGEHRTVREGEPCCGAGITKNPAAEVDNRSTGVTHDDVLTVRIGVVVSSGIPVSDETHGCVRLLRRPTETRVPDAPPGGLCVRHLHGVGIRQSGLVGQGEQRRKPRARQLGLNVDVVLTGDGVPRERVALRSIVQTCGFLTQRAKLHGGARWKQGSQNPGGLHGSAHVLISVLVVEPANLRGVDPEESHGDVGRRSILDEPERVAIGDDIDNACFLNGNLRVVDRRVVRERKRGRRRRVRGGTDEGQRPEAKDRHCEPGTVGCRTGEGATPAPGIHEQLVV